MWVLVTMAWHIRYNLQIWSTAGNILSKQSQMADKVWFFSLGIHQGANNIPVEKNLLWNVTQGFGLQKFFGKM
jgi:hypothetical protein